MKPLTWDTVVSLALAVGLAFAVGCDEDENDEYRDHVPPEGQGSLVIDNNTTEDIDLFIDGAAQFRIPDGKERIVDQDPGTYRVVLDSDDSTRSYAADVDILEGRLTILHVEMRLTDKATFDVGLEFDD